MAASEEVLGALHTEMAELLMQRIRSGDISAAELAVARGLLKDSSITCARAAGSATSELEAAMAARREKREQRRTQSQTVGSSVPLDMEAAMAQFEFLDNTGSH